MYIKCVLFHCVCLGRNQTGPPLVVTSSQSLNICVKCEILFDFDVSQIASNWNALAVYHLISSLFYFLSKSNCNLFVNNLIRTKNLYEFYITKTSTLSIWSLKTSSQYRVSALCTMWTIKRTINIIQKCNKIR